MPRHDAYPQEMIDYVRRHGPEHTVADMAQIVTERFGRDVTYGKMRAFYKNHKIHALPRLGRPGWTKFPDGFEDFMREVVPGRSKNEIAELANARYGEGTITPEQVAAYKKNHNIPSGLDMRFRKGRVPHNKGTHPKTTGRMGETQFKKGNRPHNARPVGSERVTRDGYIEIKVAEPNKWELKHRVVWEELHGPIPDGNLIVFRDGDKLNLDPDNLVMISKSVNARLNHMCLRGTEPDYFDTAVLVARVAAETGRRKNERRQGGGR